MKIAIEATLAQGNIPTGFGNYVSNLLENLSMLDRENHYFLLHSNKTWRWKNYGSNFEPVSYFCGKQSLGIYLRLNTVLKRIGADLFHATCTIGCPPNPDIPVITTIHDIFPILFPNKSKLLLKFFFENLLNLTAKYSGNFIFNSEFTKIEFYNNFKNASKINEVIYLGPSLTTSQKYLSERLKNTPIICVGAIEDRKEQLFLLEVYNSITKDGPILPKLIFLGPDRGNGRKLKKKITDYGLSASVKWLEYLSDDELIKYYTKASLLVYPSSYEGFGIPLVEAMQFKLPVICSNISVFKEIGGEYPIFARVGNIEDWKSKIINFFQGKINSKRNLVNQLLEERNWKTCAKKTLEVYKKVESS